VRADHTSERFGSRHSSSKRSPSCAVCQYGSEKTLEGVVEQLLCFGKWSDGMPHTVPWPLWWSLKIIMLTFHTVKKEKKNTSNKGLGRC